ncbi:MAG: cation-translocating P-type ATPase [Candidatus Heimdallarchaeota archaeon]|nr:cation-translocating P-type ATPase [Candidatus Heimdallarchaeota archaeon]MBY8994335.1 cation-translocating P-type ATPase [Candidatus Heimdallarchaeota archaeon]
MFKRKNKKEELDAYLDEADSDVDYHAMDTGEVLNLINADPQRGLTSFEAQSRIEQHGPNVLVEKGKSHPIVLFLKQFVDVLIGLLFIAAIVSMIFKDYIDAIVIFAIVFINGIIGFVQEYQAERSLEELKKMVSKEVRIIRDGNEHIVDSKELTVGDIVLIEAGEKVPADMRLVESTSLKVDESALTGESISLSKSAKQIIEVKAVIGDRRNMLFMGTTITYGRAKAVVVDVGMETEMGKIAALMQKEKEEPTPLQKNLDKLGKILGIIIVVICAVVFATVMVKHYIEFGNLEGWVEALETAIALAVSAVPEGLPAAITLTYAIGVRMMAKRNAIVSRLPAVETLGIVDVICSDKTGTLTKNEMTVTEIQTIDHKFAATGAGYIPEGEFLEKGVALDPRKDIELEKILRTALLCNNARVNYDKETQQVEVIGDPTEVALYVLARKAGLYDEDNYPRQIEIFFDSQRKRMTTVNRQLEKEEYEEDLIAYTKGSPPAVIERCNFASISGQVLPIDDDLRNRVLEINDEMASRALRVLAIAFRVVDERLIDVDEDDFLTEQEENIESNLIFLGLVGMIDPARPEVRDALVKCKTAGIKTVMVTGDQKVTAEAIARDIGLIEGDKWITITGTELEEMSDKELLDVIDDVKIFARVSPEHKHRIVSTFQEKGHTVAATGDGVNDAPAIKKAEIGIAMGIQGTDVTREAAQMVLADDNFATIVDAVHRGRTIFQNMLKFIRYLIASNFDEILTVFVCVVFLGLKSPYTAIQILWINLVTDGLPAIALSVDPPLSDIMREPPRKKDEGFMKDIYIFSIIAGILAFASSMIVFVPLAYVGEAVSVGEILNASGEITGADLGVINAELLNVPQWMKTFALTFTPETSLTALSSEAWYAHARTLNFTMSIVFEMFNVFITRSGFERSTFTMNPINNPWIWGSIGLAMGLQMIAIYVPMQPLAPVTPFTVGIHNTIFDSMIMNGFAWLLLLAICMLAAALMEFLKFIVGKYILKSWVGRPRKEKKIIEAAV